MVRDLARILTLALLTSLVLTGCINIGAGPCTGLPACANAGPPQSAPPAR